MFVIPSIDVYNGKCVQLINGDIKTAEVFGTPQEFLTKWVENGAKIVHIIDLNAALNDGSNKKTIIELIKNNDIEFQLGGGIRSVDYACELIDLGVKRIIIGSKLLDEGFLKKLNGKISKDQIMAALDIRNGKIVSDGWKKTTDLEFEKGLEKISSYIGSILSTDVTSEGLLNGPNIELLKRLKQEQIPTYVSGGFTTINDIKIAEKIGFSGVVIGRALYKNLLDLKGVL